ncbi:MAG: hypothetical protein H5T64_01210 [Chloroflexi bacterium]|nr:hypothetical protein [Chloroflexota bacterium]
MPPYVVGIHGTSFRSSAILADERGQVLDICQGESINIHEVLVERVLISLRQLFQHIGLPSGRSSDPCMMVCICSGGVTSDFDSERLHEVLAHLGWGHVPAIITNDAYAALVGGTLQGSGIAMTVGSSATVYGRTTAGQEHKIGGWGSMVSDPGSGYEIGRQALRAAYRSFDGSDFRCPVLERHLIEWLGEWTGLRFQDMSTVIDWLDRVRERGEIARVSEIVPAVDRAANDRNSPDPVAQAILSNAANELFASYKAVREQLDFGDEPYPVVIQGGILEHVHSLRRELVSKIRRYDPMAQVNFPKYRPVVGALLFAVARQLKLPGADQMRMVEESILSLSERVRAWALGPPLAIEEA